MDGNVGDGVYQDLFLHDSLPVEREVRRRLTPPVTRRDMTDYLIEKNKIFHGYSMRRHSYSCIRSVSGATKQATY